MALITMDYGTLPKSEFLYALIPTMSSDTTPFNSCSASAVYSNYNAWKAFNWTCNDATDCWCSALADTSGWIQYDFNSPVCVKKMVMVNRNDPTYSQPPKNFTLEGYNGSAWEVLGTYENTNYTALAKTEYDVESDKYFTQFRLNVSSTTRGKGLNIGQLQFYGLFA